jgi:hypothetical protein
MKVQCRITVGRKMPSTDAVWIIQYVLCAVLCCAGLLQYELTRLYWFRRDIAILVLMLVIIVMLVASV